MPGSPEELSFECIKALIVDRLYCTTAAAAAAVWTSLLLLLSEGVALQSLL